MTNDDGGGWSQPVPPPAYPPQGGPGQFEPPPGYPLYPPYPVPPTQPAKSRWPWIVGIIAAVAVLAAAGGLAVIFTVAKDDQPQAVTVTYEVTGPPGAVKITYHGSDGGFTGPLAVTLPWRKQETMGGEHTYVEVTAERPKASEEPLTCRITADGKVIQEEQSISSMVFCSGRLGGK